MRRTVVDRDGAVNAATTTVRYGESAAPLPDGDGDDKPTA